jgi:hypothetical protein
VSTRSSYPGYRWRRLHTVDALEIRERWTVTPTSVRVDDALLDRQRFRALPASRDVVWTVKSRYELIRLVGAVQFFNQRCNLWFRGEPDLHPHARPSRYRDAKRDHLTADGLRWLTQAARASPLIRHRRPLARLAILQHYGVPTSFLDVTSSVDVAATFALWYPGADGRPQRATRPHLSVFATPRLKDAVNVMESTNLCVVDLVAELPSFVLRPHVQRATFMALRDAALHDLSDTPDRHHPASGDLDVFRLARIHLDFGSRPDRGASDDLTRLFPAESRRCRHCTARGKRVDDLNGDLLRHELRCLGEHGVAGIPPNFPCP